MDTDSEGQIDQTTGATPLEGNEHLWEDDEIRVNSHVAQRLAIRRKIEEWREDRSIEADLFGDEDWDRPRRRRTRKQKKEVH